jgi:DNA-binding IclR family transcriptional regulator
MSLGQIAERVNLPRSTVQRIVDALRAEQFLISASPTAGVRLGPALIGLAASASVDFDAITRPVIAKLADAIGETVDLSVLKGTTAVFTDQIQGPHRLRAVSAIGEAFPLHCTANGKALLSMLPPARVAQLLAGSLRRYTKHTVTSSARLTKAIDGIRHSGLAIDDEEHTEGVCALGAGFLDPLGRVLALSTPVPTARFRKKHALLGERLLEARDRIVMALGGSTA